jgi:two-component system phosphate regulon sensor histidine kinase PhoR
MNMRKKRLLWQIYPSYLLIALATLAGLAWYATSALRTFYLNRTEDDLLARARLIEKGVRERLLAKEYAELNAECRELGKPSGTRITVILPDGLVVADSDADRAMMENHADRPEVIGALAGRTSRSERVSPTLHESRVYLGMPVVHDGDVLAVLRTSISTAEFEATLRAIQVRIVVGGVAVAVLMAGISLLLSRRIIRPLEQLQRGAERFAHGDLTHKLPVADSREIGVLAETLNQMAAELDDKLRAAVRQRNEREAILSSMVEGVLAVDSRERLIRFNEAAARLLGIDAVRAEGRTIHELVRNVELHKLVADVLASQAPQEGEMVLRDEGERFLRIQGTVLRGAIEGENGALLVFHDVTALKRLERVRRDFVANVSHELRTPVTSIKGFVETLLDGAMHKPEELQRFLTIVATQTDRLNAIIEDLLMLSRVEQEAERAEIAMSPGSVRKVLDGALEVCQRKAAEKNVGVEIVCDDELLLPMNAPLLEQAVINLLDNAIKYSAAGQSVRVEAVREAGEVVIRVCDQGCGIGREHLPRIFERFYRVDKARSRKLGGTGLGLAIVKHIAQAHHGRATVQSTVGQGSTFAIHLPAPKPLDIA